MIPEQNELFTNQQVEMSSLPSADELQTVKLEAAYKWVRYIYAALFGFFLVFVGFLVVMFQPQLRAYMLPLFLILVALAIWNVIYHGISFAHMGYAVREKDVTYKSGWLWKSMTTVPFNRVQHCDIKQGLLDRQFGLARLTIYTAGGQNTEVTIPGLLPETAEKMKTFILHGTEHAIENES